MAGNWVTSGLSPPYMASIVGKKPADVVFIKASRSVGLENFATTLADRDPAGR